MLQMLVSILDALDADLARLRAAIRDYAWCNPRPARRLGLVLAGYVLFVFFETITLTLMLGEPSSNVALILVALITGWLSGGAAGFTASNLPLERSEVELIETKRRHPAYRMHLMRPQLWS